MKRPSDTAFETASLVVERLRASGFRALFAGGCVRDMLLARPPADYDVATDATPLQVRKLFPRGRLVGAKFGVVLVRRGQHDIEVATFRTDGIYTDGRHPDDVTFGSERDDARRRDFTINGLFFDPATDEIIDYVGGRGDIEARVLRTIGDPRERFAEDYLRLLRAPRFAARLDFTIEQATRDAIIELAGNLTHMSPERVWMELEELTTSPSREAGFRLVAELGLHRFLSKELSLTAPQCGRVASRLGACTGAIIDPALAVAALLADVSLTHARKVCRSLRLSNRVTDDAIWLLSSVNAAREAKMLELADFKRLMSHRAWERLAELLRASLVAERANLAPHDALRARARGIPIDAVAPAALLPGNELIKMGVAPGPRFGEVLRAVYRAQLNGEIRTAAEARALAESLLVRSE